MGAMDDWLTLAELSELAQTERSYLRRLLARGAVSGAVKRAGGWWVPAESGRSWARARVAEQELRRIEGRVRGKPPGDPRAPDGDWITLAELAGPAQTPVHTLRRFAYLGIIRGAVKRAGVWFVPAESGLIWAAEWVAEKAKFQKR
jgi:hypothetical protein